jgi:RNA polymerase II subunit A-like phosphatase
VSEAQRLESETRSRLLKAQKLSLIVDLDQTIVHATVDPTVGEWMSDPSNPNWPALQGVCRFQLNDGPNVTNEGCYYYLKQRSVPAFSLEWLPHPSRCFLFFYIYLNTKGIEQCPSPGLSEFLHSLADKYEMHVYTMGTRAYADAVCKIIDPAGDIFGNRILSRDESGSTLHYVTYSFRVVVHHLIVPLSLAL